MEGEVLRHIQRVFVVTATDWKPSDWYFVIRNYEPIEANAALKMVEKYLKSFALFATRVGNDELAAALNRVKIETDCTAMVGDGQYMLGWMYECLTDYLTNFGEANGEIFGLKEALYSMANDYFLVAFILCPAMGPDRQNCQLFEEYFDIWRSGINIKFGNNGVFSLDLPST